MKKFIQLFFIVPVFYLFCISYIWGGELTVTYDSSNGLANGEIADVNQINQNFDDVETQVNDNNEQIISNSTAISDNSTSISNNSGDIQNIADAIGAVESLILAYGIIASDGTVVSGKNISECVWNSSSNRYEITITGESYYYLDYITLVTPKGAQLTTQTNSFQGDLLVIFYDDTGTESQTNFSFLTLKP